MYPTKAARRTALLRKKMEMDAFISEIQARPAIWDSREESYSDRNAKLRAWEEVCQNIVPNYSNKSSNERKLEVNRLQRKWKSLRDCFSRENTKIKKLSLKKGYKVASGKQYIYYKQLSFLNSVREKNNSDSEANADETQDRQNVWKSQMRKAADKKWAENMKRKYDVNINDNDPDKQFLVSLLPHVKKIDEDVKIVFQTEILQLIRKYMLMRPAQNGEIYLTDYEYSSQNQLYSTQSRDTPSVQSPSSVPSSSSMQAALSCTALIKSSPNPSHGSDQSINQSEDE